MTTLAGFTAEQWGMVTTAQAKTVGVDHMTLARLVNTGTLEHLRRGVYAATAAPEDPLRSQKAAWLQFEPRIPAWKRDRQGWVLSHRSAAQVHGIGDLVAVHMEFTVPNRLTTKHSDIRLWRADLHKQEIAMVDGLPVTTIDRTIDDLLSDHIDAGHAGDMIYDALRRNPAGAPSYAARLARHTRRYGVRGDGFSLLNHLLAQSNHTLAEATTTPTSTPSADISDVAGIKSLVELKAGLPDLITNLPEFKLLLTRVTEIVQDTAIATALAQQPPGIQTGCA